jgi:transcriptional regulator with XRE-family HTH domain
MLDIGSSLTIVKTGIREILAKNATALRRERGLTQEEVCRRAKIDPSYLWGIEKGIRNPSIEVVARLAEVYGVHPYELLIPK